MSDATAIGFVGLGAMGSPISRALLDAGHELVVYDRDDAAVARLADLGATACAGARAVADSAPVVFASLPTPEVVRDVVGELLDGSSLELFVDLSTIGPAAAEELAAVAAAAGVAYLDAPVSGGVAGAEARTLAVMAAGDDAAFERARPLLETFGGAVVHVGSSPGQGQLVKVLNNLLSATALAITSEAMLVAADAGLDPAPLLEVFSAGSGRNSATMEKFPRHILPRTFTSGFRLGLMTKDVELCLAEARRRHVPMLVGGLVQQLWTLAAARIGGDADHTEIVRLFESWSESASEASAGVRS